jgi:hypothetical protein
MQKGREDKSAIRTSLVAKINCWRTASLPLSGQAEGRPYKGRKTPRGRPKAAPTRTREYEGRKKEASTDWITLLGRNFVSFWENAAKRKTGEDGN